MNKEEFSHTWNTANPKFYSISRIYQMNMRKNPTPAEKAMWQIVKNKQLGEFKFRRQHIIGAFIVDFVCLKAKLVIEVDGRIHEIRKEYDKARTNYLNKEGLRVIRFKNEEVLNNPEKVKLEIVKYLDKNLL